MPTASFTVLSETASPPLTRRFGPLAALLALAGKSPLRARALPSTRLAWSSGAINC